MMSLFILVAITLLSRALGLFWDGADSWLEAACLGLAAMFIVTGISHFAPRMRQDFIRMVPPIFPVPAALVALTGVLEGLGAVGLLIPPLRLYAAVGLALLLIAMLPANIYAARRGIGLGGRAPTPLGIRIPMQVLYVALAVWIAVV